MKQDDKIEKLIHKIGLENNISDSTVREIVESQFEFAKEELNDLMLQINNSTQFDENLAKVFYFKALCRLYICKHRLKALLKRRNFINKVNNE